MNKKIIKTGAIIAIMAGAGIFFVKGGEGRDISELRKEMQSETEVQSETPLKEVSGLKRLSEEETSVVESFAETETGNGGESPVSESETEAPAIDDGRININTASAEELKKLSGIGDVKAQKIIEYRQSQGGFSEIEDITKVNGIGDATYEKIKDSIKVK